jgi:hypothetical protein
LAGNGTDPNAVADATDNRRAAAAVGVQADVRWTPVLGDTELSLLGGVSFLGHVNGRNDVEEGNVVVKQGAGTYDYGTVDVQARVAFPRDRWYNAVELYGSSVFIETFQKRYLTEGTLLGASNYALDEGKAFRVGVYGLGGVRSFGAGFSQRDGTRAEGGVTLDYGARRVGFGVRGGYQTEQASEDHLTERGPQGMAYVRTTVDRFDGLVSFVYQKRDYYRINRNDSRFGPTAQLAYSLNGTLSIIGTYQYLRNASTVENTQIDYDYTRHLATLGLEARL